MTPPSPLLIAHRGGSFYKPENSLAAFEYCLQCGIHHVECDVRLSKDEVPVLHHDDRFFFPGVGWRAVREMTYDQLGQLDIGKGETVPAVRELFERFGTRLHFDLELKEIDCVDKIAPLIEEYGVAERVIVSSFIPEALQVAAEQLPSIPRGLLIDRLAANLAGAKNSLKAAKLLNCRYILPEYRSINQDWMRAARANGLQLYTWTVNERADILRLTGLGVQGIISDRPQDFTESRHR